MTTKAEKTETDRKLIAKLAEVMAAVHRIPKTGRNDFHKYDYATEADIVESVRGELAQRSVMLIPEVNEMERVEVGHTNSGQLKVLTTLKMTFTFIDGETGESMEHGWIGQGLDSEDKGAYKAMTGAVKYFLLKTFLLPTGDDPEAEEAPKVREFKPAKAQIKPAAAESMTPIAEAAQAAKPLIQQLRESLEASGLPVSKMSTQSVATAHKGDGPDSQHLPDSRGPAPSGYSYIKSLDQDADGWATVELENGNKGRTKLDKLVKKLATAQQTNVSVRLGLTARGLVDTVTTEDMPF